MSAPVNRIATDKELLEAVNSADSYKEAAKALGMAYQTVKNRMHMLKSKQPSDSRPNSYNHKKVDRYFVSCVMSDAPLDKKGYKTIKNLCSDLNAQEIYIPVEYSWQDSSVRTSEPSYPKQVKEFLLSDDVDINKNLKIMGSYPLHATLQNPLTGLQTVSNGKSAIFGHPQLAMHTVASPKGSLPKLQYTTGCITEPRYTRSKAGRKAQDHHKIGGLIIEVRGSLFHVFEITVGDNKEIYHLDKLYKPNGDIEATEVEAVYMADEHVEHYPVSVKGATYLNDDSIVNVLQPNTVVRGDVYNHGSDSHHERKNVLGRIIRDSRGRNDVQAELDQCYDHLLETTVGGYQNVIVASNHHDHLMKWLGEFNPHTGDPKNIWLYHQLNADVISAALSGDKVLDPFVIYGKKYRLDAVKQCVFLDRRTEMYCAGVKVDQHGDIGVNGARGSAQNLSQVAEKSIIGHGHSPKIYRNVVQVGASGQDYGYDVGPSGWLCTHCAVYPNGATTLLHIIDGHWRL